jgi:hypothetical protein
MRPIYIFWTLLGFVTLVLIVILIVFTLPIIKLQDFSPAEITPVLISFVAIAISLANFLYNSWKEPDSAFLGEPFPNQKGLYFIRVKNRGKGKAEKCVGHLTIDGKEDILPPSNRSVWRFGTNDYVLDQDIGDQDDLLLFQIEPWPLKREIPPDYIIFPSAYTGDKRKEVKRRYEDIKIPFD